MHGSAGELFAAVPASPAWRGLDVPGLFVAWIREEVADEGRDYLGRPFPIGEDGRDLAECTTLRLEPGGWVWVRAPHAL